VRVRRIAVKRVVCERMMVMAVHGIFGGFKESPSFRCRKIGGGAVTA